VNNNYRIWGGDKLTERYNLKPPNLNARLERFDPKYNLAFRKTKFGWVLYPIL
jgi:hypothetical protein